MSAEQEFIDRTEEKKYLDAIFWGGVLVWAGLIFGADYFGYLPQIGNAITWSWIFLGAGVYGLLINFIRIFSERISNPTSWEWIWAVIFFPHRSSRFFHIQYTLVAVIDLNRCCYPVRRPIAPRLVSPSLIKKSIHSKIFTINRRYRNVHSICSNRKIQ